MTTTPHNIAPEFREPKTALITGITGQDGSYLAEFLLKRGYVVHGLVRPGEAVPEPFTSDYRGAGSVIIHNGDLYDSAGLLALIHDLRPDELYNLAAMSAVADAFDLADYTAHVNGLAVLRMLDAIRMFKLPTRFFQASTGDIFGDTPPPQNETSQFRPTNPYGIAKLFAHQMVACYRATFGVYGCAGILMNHESPRRPDHFVTRKITRSVARIRAGVSRELKLGNLEGRRDWGYAPDYVEAMWLMLQQEQPEDYVVATGEAHSVTEFVREAFAYVGLDWQSYVKVDPDLLRPHDNENPIGDATKAHRLLGWRPRTSFTELIATMVDADIALLEEELRSGSAVNGGPLA